MVEQVEQYCENNKKILKEQARNKYRELSDREKDKKREYERNRYRNMSEEEKQKLKEYQKTIAKQENQNKVFFFFA